MDDIDDQPPTTVFAKTLANLAENVSTNKVRVHLMSQFIDYVRGMQRTLRKHSDCWFWYPFIFCFLAQQETQSLMSSWLLHHVHGIEIEIAVPDSEIAYRACELGQFGSWVGLLLLGQVSVFGQLRP